MKVAIFGSSGQLGTELKRLHPEALVPSSTEVDLRNPETVKNYLKQTRPDLLINCAAYTQVDLAESHREEAFQINARIFETISDLVPKIVSFSTDYVFNGKAQRPYIETDPLEPVNAYGESKALGEKVLLERNPGAVVLRTSWLYSHWGKNFVKTMMKLGAEKSELRVVSDQWGSPTNARDLALVIQQHAVRNWNFRGGIYHYSNEGSTTWHEFAREIMRLNNLSCKVLPISSSEYPTAAKRPRFSVLDKTKIKAELGLSVPHWKESLESFFKGNG